MPGKQGAMTIGEIAAASRVNIQTVRYYERRGLLATPERTPAGYRKYSRDVVARIHRPRLGLR